MKNTAQSNREVDQAYLDEMRYELRKSLRVTAIEWGLQRGGNFFFAVYSAAKGAWDDVRNDVRKQRISLDEANQIVEKFFEFGLISQTQHLFYGEQFLKVVAHG